ncbi:MAG TPA: coenzyme A pyrophosphatase, partial [Cryomorphaceae bacterium]|nr:coenzyme A pyrophosphatase [Cryomorphaceae bacterium]
MDFNHFREELEKAFTRPLPGQDAQYQMTPAGRERVDLKRIDQEKVKQAATAALFFPMQN